MGKKGKITLRIWLQTIFTWITFTTLLVTLFFTIFPLLVLWLILRDHAVRIIIPVVRFAIKLWFFIYFFSDFDIDLNNIQKSTGPRIYIMNHSSMFDNLMMYFLPGTLKLLVKESYTRVPFLGWVISMAGGVIVRQSKNPEIEDASASYSVAITELKKGDPMIVFPEGTKTKDSIIGRFKTGGFKMALEANVELVPVVFDTWDSLRPGEWWIRDSKAVMRVLDPIPYKTYSHLDARQLSKMMKLKMAMALQEIRDKRTATEKEYYRNFEYFKNQDAKYRETLVQLQKKYSLEI